MSMLILDVFWPFFNLELDEADDDSMIVELTTDESPDHLAIKRNFLVTGRSSSRTKEVLLFNRILLVSSDPDLNDRTIGSNYPMIHI